MDIYRAAKGWKGRLLLSLVSLLPIFALVNPAWAQEEKRHRILLARHLSLDLPDIRIEGKISIFSLAPLTGQLEIKKADGDPRRIFELVSESSGILHGLAKTLPIKQLELKDCLITMTKYGLEFKFASAVIPEGFLKNVSGTVSQDRVWTVKSGEFSMASFPFPEKKWQHIRRRADIFPLGFVSLDATGENNRARLQVQGMFGKRLEADKLKLWVDVPKKEQIDLSVAAEGIKVVEPSSIADPTGMIREIMAYSGKAAQLGGLWSFDKLLLRGVVHNQDVFEVNPFRLSAPNLQIWGAIEGRRLPLPGSVEVALTAKRPGREEKVFTWKSKRD